MDSSITSKAVHEGDLMFGKLKKKLLQIGLPFSGGLFTEMMKSKTKILKSILVVTQF